MFEREGAEILRKAADHIETYGLNQDGGYVAHGAPLYGKERYQRPCCALGAIDAVMFTDEDEHGRLSGGGSVQARLLASNTLAALVHAKYDTHQGVPSWNDAPTTTQDDVTSTMREAAQKLEQAA